MIQYVLECIGFQLLFLVIYDFFLKRETFFQWNRVYLIGTYILSLALPWVKIEALKTTVSKPFVGYSEFLWNTNDLEIVVTNQVEESFHMPWKSILVFGGMGLATIIFFLKLYQIYRLRQEGEIQYLTNFTRILIKNSSVAFSFFKSIFLGDKVILKEHESIIQHELVHIRQGHSYDLIFFEIMRIFNWFNPLVYVYQARIGELHEFIADAHVAKTHKKEQYQLLLSQVFQTQHISFINPFFKSSLIKKRIVMLQKSKSKKIFQLKYLVLIPLLLGMLFYTSMASSNEQFSNITIQDPDDTALIKKVQAEIDKEVFEFGSVNAVYFNNKLFKKDREKQVILTKEEYFKSRILDRMFFKLMNDKANEDGAIKKDLSAIFPIPNTERYQIYVNRKKAFQILDENLQLSIKAYNQYVRLIDKQENYPSEFYVFEVVNAKDLTGIEVRAFNAKMDEIFEKGNAYKSMIITDLDYAFEIMTEKMQPIGVYEHNSTTENISRSGNTYTLKVLDLGNLSKGEKEQQEKLMNMIQNSVENDTLVITSLKSETKVSISPSNGNSLKKNILPNEQQQIIDVPFSTVEEVPVFPGCEDALDKRSCFQEKMKEHISKNFSYPEEAQKQGIQGKVNIMFVITEEGDIANLRMRGPSELLENEASRIISLLPKMKPGKEKGKLVRVPFSIPITFKLQGTKKDDKEENSIEDQDLAIPFAIVDEVPVFPGCEDAVDKRACFNEKIYKHIGKNFRYPEAAQELGMQGKVNTMFTISKDGSINNLKLRGPSKLLENEAERIISLLPKMTPGVYKGKTVDVPFSVPITFKLQGENDYDLVSKKFIDENPSFKESINNINDLIKKRERLLKKTSVNYSDIKDIEKQIESLKLSLDAELVKELKNK